MKPLKFHIIAIACICLIVVVLYQFIGPKPSAGTALLQTGDRYLRVASASWGLNCNDAISEAKKSRETVGLRKDEYGQVIPEAPLKPMQPDNALDAVKKLCDGKLVCEVFATSEVLGFEPMESCFKTLTLGYRCFEMDRLKINQTGQGELARIDCSLPANGSHAPAPAATQP